MGLKNNLLELADAYDGVKTEAMSIVSQASSKISDFTDKQRVKYLLEAKEFNMKNNILAVFDLAERHNIPHSKLSQLHKKYLQIEAGLSTQKKLLEELGLSNVIIGPKALGALYGNNLFVCVYTDNVKKTVAVKVYPEHEETSWSQDFEKFAYKLKKDIEKIL